MDRRVSVRVSRSCYGVEVRCRYSSENPEHVKRASAVSTYIDDARWLPHGFSTVLQKVSMVSPCQQDVLTDGVNNRTLKSQKQRNFGRAISKTPYDPMSRPPSLSSNTLVFKRILGGPMSNHVSSKIHLAPSSESSTFLPRTVNFLTLCHVTIDATTTTRIAQRMRNEETNFYRIQFEVVLLFGLTELQAQVAWKEHVSFNFVRPSGCSI